MRTSSKHGAAAQWVISAWAKGGNLPDATVRLQATPASVTPRFSFGCGSSDGSASCNLGAMDAKSAQRQLEADTPVPATASTVKSVRLVVIGSAASLIKDPKAAATVAIRGTTTPTPTPAPAPSAPSTSPIPVGTLPGVSINSSSTGASLSPGGNASGLFPTLKPSPSGSSPTASASRGRGRSESAKARQAAYTSALPESAPVVGAQLAGLAALLVALVLAVTRFSIRRRPVPGAAAAGAGSKGGAAAEPEAAKAPGTPDAGAKPEA